ncbi:MAG TPA: glycosyltransferase [Flavobacteriales bacterium]|nr:glycosyltransferase [Flavobacteriales bacterium]
MNTEKLLHILSQEKVDTWFDLGLLIDKIKEDGYSFSNTHKQKSGSFVRQAPVIRSNTFDQFKKKLSGTGIAFITYHFSVDGVTVEIQKYAKALKSFLPDLPIHFVSGGFMPEADCFIDKSVQRHTIKEINGFDSWKLYEDFFFNQLQRGSKEYNDLIKKFWQEVLVIVEKLGYYLETNNIQLLYLINVCSNPGNVSLSLALVLISEYLQIPVINNNHDYYWEGGNRKIDITNKGLKQGPRDFFFTNSHLGEFFSQIDVLFPWESRNWLTVNINRNQTDHVININGHNPANVSEIGTAVDLERYKTLTKRKKINAFLQVQKMLGGYKKSFSVKTPSAVLHHFDYDAKPVVIGYKKSASFDFVNNNIVFLQPTRLMPRKRIEWGFRLIERLFENDNFLAKFDSNPKLTLTFLITGPIPMGQINYSRKLIMKFDAFVNALPPRLRERVFLAFLFSEFDKERFKRRVQDPVDIPELYNIASLIMLPSETEGRGLPIIEATACGIPIFCRRYYPENVYAEVIGEHLNESERLKVLEFNGKNISDSLVDKITKRVFFPQNFIDEVEHNKRVVENRYSIEALRKNFESLLYKLYLQVSDNLPLEKSMPAYVSGYSETLIADTTLIAGLINDKNRSFLPGFGRLRFMSYLKSLIDPSFFRVEEQQVRAMAMRFAKKLVVEDLMSENYQVELLHQFYNTVDNIFKYYKGILLIRHDHSFAYRHRNNRNYPYQDFTIQELTGLVNYIYYQIAKPKGNQSFRISPHFFTDWNLALLQLTNSQELEIDDRELMVKKLKSDIPLAYFPGEYVKYEIEFFILQPIRARLGLKIEDELQERHLINTKNSIAKVYIFCQEKPLGKWYTADTLEKYLKTTNDLELRLLFKHGICKVVRTKQWTVGVHFKQLGNISLKVLKSIKAKGGFIITNGDNAPVMTDIINLDRFHIGKVENDREITSAIMGVKEGNGFIQFVPAGVRTTLAYPTPVQTAKDFSEALKSDLYIKLSKKLGEKKMTELIRSDAEKNGTPIYELLKQIYASSLKKGNKKASAGYRYITGVYEDGMPWNGVLATIDNSSKKWRFATHTVLGSPQTVTELVKHFDKRNNVKSRVAWNGGYILNPELVGKLALSEAYIGSPLGLLISNGKVVCPPLFNKPAFIIYKDGKIDIEKVCSQSGMEVKISNRLITFSNEGYNKHSSTTPCFYDLLNDKSEINADGNTIIRIAGNTIKEVIKTRKGQHVKSIPVGLTFSIPAKFCPEIIKVGQKVTIMLNQIANGIAWKNVLHAIEAGPMLLKSSKNAINMKLEGWKTENSIATQAARLDFTDMRGPKIAVGIDKKANIMVLTINGRIRESVGATHDDMSSILKSYGAVKAMGFDPGGSSTLVMDGKTLNISPYNHQFESNIFALPPEPRAVANAIIGWQE